MSNESTSTESILARMAERAKADGDPVRMHASDKAAVQWAKGTRPVHTGAGWLIESRTASGLVYRTSKPSCSCAAGLAGRYCWHRALVHALETPLPPTDSDALFTRLHTAVAEAEAALYQPPAIPTEAEVERERALAAIYVETEDWY